MALKVNCSQETTGMKKDCNTWLSKYYGSKVPIKGTNVVIELKYVKEKK